MQEMEDGEQMQASASQGLTKSEAERVLASLVAEGWFELSKGGYYSLSPRALMELRGWLIETYNEGEEEEGSEDEERVDRIKLCQACKEIVTIVSLPALTVPYRTVAEKHRVNDVPTWSAQHDYITSAHGTCSGCRMRRPARCARRLGMASASSERKRRGRGREEAQEGRRDGQRRIRMVRRILMENRRLIPMYSWSSASTVFKKALSWRVDTLYSMAFKGVKYEQFVGRLNLS